MKNEIRTFIRSRKVRVLIMLPAALALSNCGGHGAKTADQAGDHTVTTAANGQTLSANTVVEDTGELVTVDGLPLLTVDRIEPGVDGYTAYLTDSIGGEYNAVISIPNLEDKFVTLEVGDVVTIAGSYAESFPVRILNVTNITVNQ